MEFCLIVFSMLAFRVLSNAVSYRYNGDIHTPCAQEVLVAVAVRSETLRREASV